MKTELCREQIEKLSEENAELRGRIDEWVALYTKTKDELNDVILEQGIENSKLRTRIAELKEFVERLIRAGNKLILPNEVFGNEQSWAKECWYVLVEGWKRCKKWGK